MTVKHDMQRFARLKASGLSFGSAFAPGRGLDHIKLSSAKAPQYNGAGLAGDKDALAGDFRRAIRSAKGDDVTRG
jgi:hypothetical protein